MRGLELDREGSRPRRPIRLLLATDAAEALVREGVPFRDAHAEQVAESVRDGSGRGAGVASRTGLGLRGGVDAAVAAARTRSNPWTPAARGGVDTA